MAVDLPPRGTVEVEGLIEQMPAPIAAAATTMMRDRIEMYGDTIYAIAEIRVVDDGRGGSTVRAEARLQAH